MSYGVLMRKYKRKKKLPVKAKDRASALLVYDADKHPQLAFDLFLVGLTYERVAEAMGVSKKTLERWKDKYPEFQNAVESARDQANGRVARSLYERANGYSHPAVKIMTVPTVDEDGNKTVEIVHEAYTEHYPPDTQAAMFFLKNRTRPGFDGTWKDKSETELSGPDGEPLVAPPFIIEVVPPPERKE